MINKLTIRKPNDMHVHFRDDDLLSIVIPETDKIYQNCIVMPNLVPPITSQKMAIDYLARIKKYIKNGLKFLFSFFSRGYLKVKNVKFKKTDYVKNFNKYLKLILLLQGD